MHRRMSFLHPFQMTQYEILGKCIKGLMVYGFLLLGYELVRFCIERIVVWELLEGLLMIRMQLSVCRLELKPFVL